MVSARVKGTVPVSLTEAAYTYDSEGRVTKIAIGQRAVSFGYGVDGFLSSVVGPTGTTTVDARDAVGRVLRITQPGNRTTSVAYDANGNPVSVTPPGRTAHTFGFNLGDLVSTYTPPDVGQNPRTTSFAYDKDQLPTQETTPAVASTFGFDGTKRLVTRTDGARSVLYERLPGGRVQRAVVTAATGNVTDEVSYLDALPSGDSLTLGGLLRSRGPGSTTISFGRPRPPSPASGCPTRSTPTAP
jgi:YD repeat-containing protein